MNCIEWWTSIYRLKRQNREISFFDRIHVVTAVGSASIKSPTNKLQPTLNSWQRGWTKLHSFGKVKTRVLSCIEWFFFLCSLSLLPFYSLIMGARSVCAINPIWLRTHRSVALACSKSRYEHPAVSSNLTLFLSVSRLFWLNFPDTPNPMTFRSPGRA